MSEEDAFIKKAVECEEESLRKAIEGSSYRAMASFIASKTPLPVSPSSAQSAMGQPLPPVVPTAYPHSGPAPMGGPSIRNQEALGRSVPDQQYIGGYPAAPIQNPAPPALIGQQQDPRLTGRQLQGYEVPGMGQQVENPRQVPVKLTGEHDSDGNCLCPPPASNTPKVIKPKIIYRKARK